MFISSILKWAGLRRQLGSRRTRAVWQTSGSVAAEQLELRTLLAATADLVAWRPVNQYIDYSAFTVPEAVETDPRLGPGIRINGDDDNRNGKADYLDKTRLTAADNDLVRLEARGTGTSLVVSWTGPLVLWTSATKSAAVQQGQTVSSGQTLWAEYVSSTHTTGSATSVQLTATDATAAGTSTATDTVVFHSFQSIVVAIGGNTQDPARVGDSTLGTFTMGRTLYQQGYDVHLFAHGAVQSTGRGAVYDEIVSAVTKRNVDYVGIFGYSWGGGATRDLANALKGTTSLAAAGYRLQYTAYVDGIRHNSISAETRLPPGTAYHDNFYQRKDTLLKGNSVAGATNINVTQTTWGRQLVHTTIDDNATLQQALIGKLMSRMIA